MKKIIIAGAAAALLVAGGYTTGAWLVGKRIESGLDKEYAELAASLPEELVVISREHKRGVFSSHDKMTLEFNASAEEKAVRFVLESRISHLPLAGLFHLRAAAADSTLAMDPPMPELTGGGALATIHTELSFTGSGTASITTPALKTQMISSEEGSFRVEFGPDGANYSLQGGIPSIAFKSNGVDFQLKGVHVEGKHQPISADLPHLYAGYDRMAIDQLDLVRQDIKLELGNIKNFAMDVAVAADAGGSYLDYTAKMRLEGLKIMGGAYGPVQFDTAFRHLDAHVLENLSRMDMSGKNKEADMVMEGEVDKLLMHDPEAWIERFSFNHPQGEVLLSGRVKFNGVQPGDAAKGLIWSKGAISADFRVPVQLLAGLGSTPFAPPVLRGESFDQTLRSLLAAGYISQEGNHIKSQIEFRDARLMMNGKPFGG